MSKSELLPIEQVVDSAISTYFETDRRLKFVVGVSGGPDSMALLYILHQLDIAAHVVHINYGKRGTASDRDAKLVKDQSEKWNFSYEIISADSSGSDGENFQQWARQFRYTAFEQLAEQISADAIALAHHRDDQIETILQKQFRGASLESWSAMPVWDGQLFRPLLSISKQEILEFCADVGIPYRTDESNLEDNFARNFLRNKWLKQLEDHFPGWQKNVLRMAEQADLHGDALDWISEAITDRQDRIDRKALLKMDPSLRRSVILHKLRGVRPGLEVSSGTLHELDKLAELQTGKQVELDKNLSLMRDRGYFKMVYHQPKNLIVASFKQEDLDGQPFQLNGVTFFIDTISKPDYQHKLYLDVEKLAFPLTLRFWKKGDRFRPFGMEGHQNVSDHLANRKISAAEKKKALVLESFEETICAVIFPPIENRVPPGTISEAAKCTAHTRKYLIVKLK